MKTIEKQSQNLDILLYGQPRYTVYKHDDFLYFI